MPILARFFHPSNVYWRIIKRIAKGLINERFIYCILENASFAEVYFKLLFDQLNKSLVFVFESNRSTLL